MRRFLLLWLVLTVAGILAAAAVSVGVYHRLDLRFDVFVRLLGLPVLQALLLLALRGASLAPLGRALRAVARDPLGRAVVVLELAIVGWAWAWPRDRVLGAQGGGLLLSTSALALGGVAAVVLVLRGLLERRRLAERLAVVAFAIALFAVIADMQWPWHGTLAFRLLPKVPAILRAIVVYGALVGTVLVLGLRAGRALGRQRPEAEWLLEIAAALAFAASLSLVLNTVMVPFLTPPWRGLVRTFSALSALMTLLGATHGVFRPGVTPARAARHAADLVVALLILPLVAPLWLLSWRGASALGRVYGRLAFVLWPSGRRTAMINLRRAHGADMDRSRARAATWRVMTSLGQAVGEGVQFARRHAGGRGDWAALYAAEAPELEARLLADPRPKIFVTAHLGSWEVALMLLTCRGVRGGAVARHIDNAVLDAVVRRFRTPHPDQWIDKRGAAEDALGRLEAGESVALLLDENGGHRGTFVTFLGREASTARLAALLSIRTGAPIVAGAAVRRPGPRPFLYRLAAFEPPAVDMPGDGVRALTQQVTAQLEAWIREDPEQWRWAHHRWKTRPDGREETYARDDLRQCFAEPRAAGAPAREGA